MSLQELLFPRCCLLHHVTCGTLGNDVRAQQFGMPQGEALLRGCCGDGMDAYKETCL